MAENAAESLSVDGLDAQHFGYDHQLFGQVHAKFFVINDAALLQSANPNRRQRLPAGRRPSDESVPHWSTFQI